MRTSQRHCSSGRQRRRIVLRPCYRAHVTRKDTRRARVRRSRYCGLGSTPGTGSSRQARHAALRSLPTNARSIRSMRRSSDTTKACAGSPYLRLAAQANSVDARTRVVDALGQLLDDPIVPRSTCRDAAAESLGDERLLGALDRLGRKRLSTVECDAMPSRRHNAFAKTQKVPAQVTALRTDIDALREDQRKLQEKIEALAGS